MVQLHFSCPGGDGTLGYARDQLAAYLTRMLPDTDAAIRAELTVAAPMPLPRGRWDAFLDDWYRIQADPGSIRIQGSNPRAVLLGVYRLLHVLGCRFLMPGTDHETVPVISPEDLCADLTESASCRHRGVCIEGADSVENVLDFIDWLPKIGCNSFFVQHLEPEAFLKNWYDHKYNPLLAPQALSGEDYARMYREIDQAIALRGLLHHRVGHGWTCKAIGFEHVCAHLPAPTDEQRPLLAEVNGRREFWQGVPSNTNLCYSNATAADAFVRSVVEYAARHPEVDFLHVWLADEVRHPLNEFVLAWVDYGVAVPCLIVLFFGFSIFRLSRRKEGFSIALACSLFALFVFACFSYPTKYPLSWLVAVAALACLLWKPLSVRLHGRFRRVYAVAFGLLSIAVWTGLVVEYHYERTWSRAARCCLHGYSEQMMPVYGRLYRHYSRNPYFLYNYAAEQFYAGCFASALETARECRVYWSSYNLELLTGDICRHSGRYEEAISHYLQAGNMCPVRFAPLEGLYHAYKDSGDTRKADSVSAVIRRKEVKVPSSDVVRIKEEAGGGPD